MRTPIGQPAQKSNYKSMTIKIKHVSECVLVLVCVFGRLADSLTSWRAISWQVL